MSCVPLGLNTCVNWFEAGNECEGLIMFIIIIFFHFRLQQLQCNETINFLGFAQHHEKIKFSVRRLMMLL